MARSCLEGREESKETELPEAAEMQRGHRLWAHTHHCSRGPSAIWGHSIFPPVSPAGPGRALAARLSPATPLHHCLHHWTSLSDATGHRAGRDSLAQWREVEMELWWVVPRHSKVGQGEDYCWQGSSHSTYSLQAARQGFFVLWMKQRPENFKATWELQLCFMQQV